MAGSSPRSGFTAARRGRGRATRSRSWRKSPTAPGGRLIAAFGANDATPRAWTAQEIELVRDVAERTWDAVERSRAEAAIFQGEQRLRLALDASGGGSWTWTAATNQADWDERFRTLY